MQVIKKLLGSKWFFYFTLYLFAAEAGYLALTSRFPMAFDESYHFSLIQFFSHHLNPIVTAQSPSTYGVGNIIQNPDFLYHYLLSFPDRFIHLFSHSIRTELVILRLINVALALASLLAMRKTLSLMRLPRALANIVIFAVAFTPMVTVLSAQISYDNLFVLLIVLSVNVMIIFLKKLADGIFDSKNLLTLMVLCLFASLVKYAYLPIFLGIAIVTGWKIIIFGQRDKAALINSAKKSFIRTSQPLKTLLLLAVLLGSFLFVRFYGVNLVRYHNPAPQCNQVLGVQACTHYYAWNSNYNLWKEKETRGHVQKMDIFQYSGYWLVDMSTFLYGSIIPLQGIQYLSPIYYTAVLFFTIIGIICAIVNYQNIIRNNRGLVAALIISLVYVLALWARNYHDFSRFGVTVAINGRYLVPVLVYVYALFGLGIYYALNGPDRFKVIAKPILIVIIIASFLVHGGYVQYIANVAPRYGGIGASDYRDSVLITPYTN